MKNLITSAITLAFSVTSIADDHKPDWAVEIGNAVAQTVWLCDLINGSTMEDVTRIDKRLHKYLDTHQLRIKRDIILPSLDTYSGYDYGALEWATWDEWGRAQDIFSTTEEGQSIAAAYGEIEKCNRWEASVYPIMRDASVMQDATTVATVNWCKRRPGVSTDQLISKHSEIVSRIKDTHPAVWWGVAYPELGVQQGQAPGDFYHYMIYPDYKALAKAKNSQANKEGWRNLEDYYTSYADCAGQVAVDVETVRWR
tara:strand:- start:583 stop:1347 length:765 start_codon:yes stop_codon:yes gene_type:complete